MPEFIVIRNYKDKGYSEGSTIKQGDDFGAIEFPFALIRDSVLKAYDAAQTHVMLADFSTPETRHLPHKQPLDLDADYIAEIEITGEIIFSTGIKWFPKELKIISAEPISALDVGEKYEHDEQNRCIYHRDAYGVVNTYEYDSLNRTTRHTKGTSFTQYVYDGESQRILIENTDGRIRNFRFDINGNSLNHFDSSGEHTYWFDLEGRQTHSVTPSGEQTVRHYNKNHRLIYSRDPSGMEEYFVYEPCPKNGERLVYSAGGPLNTRKEWIYEDDGKIRFIVNGNDNGMGEMSRILQSQGIAKLRDSLDEVPITETIEAVREIMQKEDPQ